ncbi:MAG TPA: respiratory nitrate reductase subunit gamma [bacterium]|jgi:nitrate reductase gamma subunit
MNWNDILFGIVPYVAIFSILIVGPLRWRHRQYTHTSGSTQFLENTMQFWGSVPWHYGILSVILVHLIALFIPQAIILWTGDQLRLWILEITGFGMGLLATFGLVMLLFRRMSNTKVLNVTRPWNFIVLILLLIQVINGVVIAGHYRWGSIWGATSMNAYVWSIFMLRPDISYIATMPFPVKWHVFNAWLLLGVAPFTPLVHLFSIPLTYFMRPPILVIWNRPRRKPITE